LSLLREIIPQPGVIAFVVNQNSTSTPVQLQEMKEAAQAIAQPLLILNAAIESEIDEAFATMSREKVVAVVFGASVFYQVVADRLIALAARHRIPALYEWREFVVAGGLMSYNANRAESGRQVGAYAAQILKGASRAICRWCNLQALSSCSISGQPVRSALPCRLCFSLVPTR
jgi:putative ABC transport system substrate-binding protein